VIVNFLAFILQLRHFINTQGPFYITLYCATHNMVTLCIASDGAICTMLQPCTLSRGRQCALEI